MMLFEKRLLIALSIFYICSGLKRIFVFY